MRVLFLCTGNSCRSQMAEGWLRHLAGSRIDVESAGLEAHGLNPAAVQAMADRGIDISAQTSKVVDAAMVARANLVVTVCGHADAHCPVLPPTVIKQHWPFEDPARVAGDAATIKRAFEETCRAIEARVRTFLAGYQGEGSRNGWPGA